MYKMDSLYNFFFSRHRLLPYIIFFFFNILTHVVAISLTLIKYNWDFVDFGFAIRIEFSPFFRSFNVVNI